MWSTNSVTSTVRTMRAMTWIATTTYWCWVLPRHPIRWQGSFWLWARYYVTPSLIGWGHTQNDSYVSQNRLASVRFLWLLISTTNLLWGVLWLLNINLPKWQCSDIVSHICVDGFFQKLLQDLAKQGSVVAKLPDVHLVPDLRKRLGKWPRSQNMSKPWMEHGSSFSFRKNGGPIGSMSAQQQLGLVSCH